MSSPSIMFGLAEFPRLPREGFFYYTLPPKFSHWAKSAIAVLDLYNVDEGCLSSIFHKGIKTLLQRKGLSGEAACAILENHATENIKDFAQDILQKVIDEIKHSEMETSKQP